MRSLLLCRISEQKVISHWISDSSEKLIPCLDTVWHLRHLTIPVELLSFPLSFIDFLHSCAFLKQLLQLGLYWVLTWLGLCWLALCFPESHPFPPATPILSLVTWLLPVFCLVCVSVGCISAPLSYSFSVVILGGHFYFLWLPTLQRNFLNPPFQTCHHSQVEVLYLQLLLVS